MSINVTPYRPYRNRTRILFHPAVTPLATDFSVIPEEEQEEKFITLKSGSDTPHKYNELQKQYKSIEIDESSEENFTAVTVLSELCAKNGVNDYGLFDNYKDSLTKLRIPSDLRKEFLYMLVKIKDTGNIDMLIEFISNPLTFLKRELDLEVSDDSYEQYVSLITDMNKYSSLVLDEFKKTNTYQTYIQIRQLTSVVNFSQNQIQLLTEHGEVIKNELIESRKQTSQEFTESRNQTLKGFAILGISLTTVTAILTFAIYQLTKYGGSAMNDIKKWIDNVDLAPYLTEIQMDMSGCFATDSTTNKSYKVELYTCDNKYLRTNEKSTILKTCKTQNYSNQSSNIQPCPNDVLNPCVVEGGNVKSRDSKKPYVPDVCNTYYYRKIKPSTKYGVTTIDSCQMKNTVCSPLCSNLYNPLNTPNLNYNCRKITRLQAMTYVLGTASKTFKDVISSTASGIQVRAMSFLQKMLIVIMYVSIIYVIGKLIYERVRQI